jgi:signal transduction histidine kinase
LHIDDGRTDVFSRADGLSSESIHSLFEDREGNIWVATGSGLDRFREFAVSTISVEQGLSSQGVSSILAARDGSLWLGTSDGLNRWNKGQITIYRKRSLRGGSQASGFTAAVGADSKRTVREITDRGLPEQVAETFFEDNHGQIWVGTRSGVAIFKADRFFPVPSVPYGIVYAITGDGAENVWISHEQGLFHLFQSRVVERIAWAELGRRQPATAALRDARQGGLWLGFRDGGVAYFKDNQLRASYGGAEGLGEGYVRSIYLDASGSLWVGTEGGLSRIKDGSVLTLNSQNGLPCNLVHWMMEDDARSVWLYLACGLVRIARSELDAWTSHPRHTIQTTVFDSFDGVSNHRFTGGYNANVAKSADGKLWFTRVGGVGVLDPHHLPVNKLPPPVHIEQIVADGKTYDANDGLRLPPHVRDLAIDYTGLSFTAPEKMQFRVKLEGQDNDWRVPVNPRHSHYTNLAPRNYRFRVIASNNSGVWNNEGDTFEFSIAPAYYQTNWFRALCVAAFLALLWGLYQLRVRQLAWQFNMRLDERVSERTRIARDLHDTLLQSFQGLLPRFQAAIYKLPPGAVDARNTLEAAVDQASQAITEGRDAVQGLRVSTVEKNDLAMAIQTIGEELAAAGDQPPPQFEVVVEGRSRSLHPILRDEVYRITAEALRNAFRHAQARHIEAHIRYGENKFRVHVRDDGRGIHQEILSGDGRAGHYGLHGMRERADLVGGKLAVWSEVGAGTEVELEIPAGSAYAKTARRSWFSAKLASKQ